MSYKATLLVLISIFGCKEGLYAQEQKIADSLALIYQQHSLTDTAKLKILNDLSFNEVSDLKKGLGYAEEMIRLSQDSDKRKYLRMAYFLKGTKKRLLGNLDEALAAYFKSAQLAKEMSDTKAEGESYGAIADIYSVGNNHANAMNYYNIAISNLRLSKDSVSLASYISNAGDEYLKIKNYDSALLFFEEAKIIFDKVKPAYLSGKAYSLGNIGMVYASVGKNALAEINMNEAISILEKAQDYYPICVYLTSIADIYSTIGDQKAAFNYNIKSLHLAQRYGLKEQVSDASLKLSEWYEKEGNTKESLKYYKTGIAYRDSVNSISSAQKMFDLRTNYEVSQKQLEVNLLNKQRENQKKLNISLVIILGLTVVLTLILLKNNRNKQKAYKILGLQKQETDEQKTKAENALKELQVTQKQLIQSAKMASLGELTAGIAHEIQNPLNFVNNFSDLSVDLLDELTEAVANKLTETDKSDAKEIIVVLTDNLRKISDHGKRADSIVKGMLQHSRTNTGNKELTDLNALADEYLRLSYYGLRAKDKEFYSNFTTNFDASIGKIEVVPQDIGRVLLNLFNNAFYAVNKRKKQDGTSFEPTVSVKTKRYGSMVEISVKDNGLGIPQNILEKIFQPFFTTKPTGQGTGLGLSISYDIIKASGGDLKVETQDGEFAEFIVQLPASDTV